MNQHYGAKGRDGLDRTLQELFPRHNRKAHLSVCAILTGRLPFTVAILCLVFGVLNIIGYTNTKQQQITFGSGDCDATKICKQTIDLDFSSKTYLYLKYPFFQTSYFVYMKGLRYADVFGDNPAYLSDNKECYPVGTVSDLKNIYKQLGLQFSKDQQTYVNSKQESDRVTPCGLKAALAGKTGVLSITNSSSSSVVTVNTDQLVDPYYSGLAKASSTSDFVNTKDQTFLSWYLPQIPGFGVKLFNGILPNGLNGKFEFKLDLCSFR